MNASAKKPYLAMLVFLVSLFRLPMATADETISDTNAPALTQNSPETGYPAEWHDPAFNKLVDLKLLANVVSSGSVEYLTSAALQFLNAEQVLQRSHHAITAEDLFRRAVDVALSQGDSESLDRLKAAATAADNNALLGIVDSATQLNAGSRTMTSDLVISLDDLTPDQFAHLKTFRKSIQHANLIGNSTDFQKLRERVERSSLPDAAKTSLMSQLSKEDNDDASAKSLRTLGLASLQSSSRRHRQSEEELFLETINYDPNQVGGTAREIAAGGLHGGSQAWIVGTVNENAFGFALFERDGNEGWRFVPGDATKVAVDTVGKPWIINKQNRIWYMSYGGTWHALPGLAQEIATGGDGSVYIIATATDENHFGFGVYKWTGTDWAKQPGDAIKIAVDRDGNPWLINKQGGIWRRLSDGQWQHLPGVAQEIAASHNSKNVVIVATDQHPGGYGIYQWDESSADWVRIPGVAGVKIAIGNDSMRRLLSGYMGGGTYETLWVVKDDFTMTRRWLKEQ